MFYDRFLKLCEDKGVTPAQVGRDLDINKSTISMWRIQKSTPTPMTLVKIADYFSVSLDYLLIGVHDLLRDVTYYTDLYAQSFAPIYKMMVDAEHELYKAEMNTTLGLASKSIATVYKLDMSEDDKQKVLHSINILIQKALAPLKPKGFYDKDIETLDEPKRFIGMQQDLDNAFAELYKLAGKHTPTETRNSPDKDE